MTVNLNDDQVNVYSASSRTYSGKTWSGSAAMPAGFGDGQAVSCPASRFCAAIDDGGDAAIYNGTAWAHGVSIDPGPVQTVDISCATKDFCVVVDQKGDAVAYNGKKWGRPVPIDRHGAVPGTTAELAGVPCATEDFCVAVGGDDAVTGT